MKELTGPQTAVDVTPQYLVGLGIQIRRQVDGYAYPRTGNAHNPTPRYSWSVYRNGRLVESLLTTRSKADDAVTGVLRDLGLPVPVELLAAERRADAAGRVRSGKAAYRAGRRS